MLAFLTDEHISHEVAEQVRLKRPEIRIESILQWQGGALRGRPDDKVLIQASTENLTLVTYDQRTIPPILMEFAMNGEHHTGVVFVDRKNIPTSNIGGLVTALIRFYDNYGDLDWTDVVMYLSP